jgi:DNA-binding response OmpR family regulator
VTCAAGGPAGRGLARAAAFDIIALDHYMPGQDGLDDPARIMRRCRAGPPVVYVTGSEESRIAVAALKAGAADYVVKTSARTSSTSC